MKKLAFNFSDMLGFKQKLSFLKNILSEKESSYADSFNGYILIAIDGFEGLNFNFLEQLGSKISIRNWVNALKSRIVMHEDDNNVNEIINDFIYCG